ncbi:MAG: transposase [Planctomycetales bacterium]
MQLTKSFTDLLQPFRYVFTAPSFALFQLLTTGWILSQRRRFVTDLIITSDSVGNRHFSAYHRFFSRAKWSIDDLWKQLAEMLVARFVGPDAVILIAGDDTLCRKRGLNLFGAGMHHDPLISST